MITTYNLNKSFGTHQVIKNLDLCVRKNAFFVLLGPNAAGKTTTMKLLAGLLKPDSGQISIGSIDLLKNPVRAREIIGYIPDHPFLYEKLTGLEFIEFIRDIYRKDKRAFDLNMGRLLQLLGLNRHITGECIENYSHGMKQRLIIAVTLAREPLVLMMDEPLVGLDPRTANIFKTLLKKECEKGRLTVIISTHTLSVAKELADEVGIIHRGELSACGPLSMLEEIAGTTDLEKIFLTITQDD
ncbi:MAG: ABC transporter ATP-binding protein [Candidatus Omnitrophica bacterium]|nr:ABC transporter ATP-binding protein [Candidatus Omnitrophota bacterium]